MKPARARSAAAIAGIAVSLMTSAAPAVADTGSFRDAGDDIADPVDQVRVVVTNADRVRVAIHHRDLRDRRFTERIWFDTDPRDRGPEFRLVADYPFDLELKPVEDWDQRRPGPLREACGRVRFDYDFGGDVSSYSWPRRCFGPGRIRVATAVEGADPPRDWLAGRREFTEWVRAY